MLFGSDPCVLAGRSEREMRDVGVDALVADEGRGELEDDAVGGKGETLPS
jgi:hypothetical protein